MYIALFLWSVDGKIIFKPLINSALLQPCIATLDLCTDTDDCLVK